MFAPSISVVAAATLSFAAAPAMAGTFESNGSTMQVRYGDLDLTTSNGQQMFSRRINAATAKVCDAYDTDHAQKLCRQQTLNHVKAPIAQLVARAAAKAHYAALKGETKVATGN